MRDHIGLNIENCLLTFLNMQFGRAPLSHWAVP